MIVHPSVHAALQLASLDAAATSSGVAGPDWITSLNTAGGWVLATAMIMLCIIAWLANLFSLPGNWVAVTVIGLYAWLGPTGGRYEMTFAVAATAFGLAILGEAVEFAAAAVGVSKAGASRRATLYAMVGSIAGAIVGAMVGIPVPIIGSIIAAILFGGLGAAAGAIYAQWSDGGSWRENWSVGQAAFWGRTFGVLGKLLAGLAILLLALIAVLV